MSLLRRGSRLDLRLGCYRGVRGRALADSDESAGEQRAGLEQSARSVMSGQGLSSHCFWVGKNTRYLPRYWERTGIGSERKNAEGLETGARARDLVIHPGWCY